MLLHWLTFFTNYMLESLSSAGLVRGGGRAKLYDTVFALLLGYLLLSEQSNKRKISNIYNYSMRR